MPKIEVCRGWQLPAVALGLALALGCGARDKGEVVGKVVFNGQPVTGGSITFVPRTPAGRSMTRAGCF